MERFVQIGWDDAFILWAKALRDAIAAHGPSSIGAIGGGRLTNEEAFALQHSSAKKASRTSIGARAGSVKRRPAPGAPLERIDSAQAIVIVGESPEERAPVLWLRVRKAALGNGARIVRTENAARAREATVTQRALR